MYGNGALSGYAKVGLLTADEVAFAGSAFISKSIYYLYGNTNSNWWTLSPSVASYSIVNVWSVSDDGGLAVGNTVTFANGVRPSLSLVSSTKVTGAGTATNPYKVIME